MSLKGSQDRADGYPGFAVTNAGRKMLNEVDPAEAQRPDSGRCSQRSDRTHQRRTHPLPWPACATKPEDWNDFWSEYKNA